MKFIYTFSMEDREKLLSKGYVLLKEDSKNKIYVFASNDTVTFQNDQSVQDGEYFKGLGINVTFADTLTF